MREFNVSLFKELVKKNDLTYEKLAMEFYKRGIQISVPAIKYWTRQTRATMPETEKLIILGDILGIDPNSLLSGKKIYGVSPVKRVPVVGTSSCGKSITDDYQGNNEYAYYNGEYWTKNLYCVIACGDSMSPFIDDGDEIICDPERKPQHGDVVEYKIRNEKAVKIFTEDKNANIIQLVPYNQNNENFQTRTIRLDDDEANELEMSVVVAVNKLAFKNRKAILKAIGRA